MIELSRDWRDGQVDLRFTCGTDASGRKTFGLHHALQVVAAEAWPSHRWQAWQQFTTRTYIAELAARPPGAASGRRRVEDPGLAGRHQLLRGTGGNGRAVQTVGSQATPIRPPARWKRDVVRHGPGIWPSVLGRLLYGCRLRDWHVTRLGSPDVPPGAAAGVEASSCSIASASRQASERKLSCWTWSSTRTGITCTPCESPENRVREIRPGLNGLHVHEEPLRAEAINQAIGQPSGDVSAFPAAKSRTECPWLQKICG